ncbi:MAG: cytochrome c-type biogenesis protein CcmH [Pseudomonadota bacterium]|nr:cytochrome c-type biogenesis protein CcmH [Pseudomonadota bacterium]
MTRVFALLLLLAAGTASAIDPERLEDPVQQQRYDALIHELRCLKCQGETVADTPAMFAVDIRRQVRSLISEGRSDVEVKQYLVDRYGEMILLKPRSPWLWIAPVIFLLGGALVAWRVLGQRRQLLGTDDSDPDEGGRAA